MGLSVFWQDEEGAILERFDEPGFDLRILDLASPTRACLRFVDPYGDTVFNQMQVEELKVELRTACDVTDELSLQAAIRGLITFLDRCTGHVHTYVKVYGD